MKPLSILIYILLASQIAWANAKVIGNGGDFFSLYPETMWFDKASGKKTVTACIERSKDFSKNTDNSQIKKIIISAYEQWAEYLRNKGDLFVRNRLNESYEDAIVKKYSEVIVPNISVLNRCFGNEDLTFLLGTSNKEVEVAKKRFQQPLAFAILEDFNFNKRWGKGFIWISAEGSLLPNIKFPQWDHDSLKATFLHEIGHVFGQPHVDQTIMTEAFVDFLMHTGHWGARSIVGFENERGLRSFYLNNIDHQRTLIPCLECIPNDIEGLVSEYYFKRLTGEEPAGAILAKVVRTEMENRQLTFLLIVSDSLRAHTFKIYLDPAPRSIIAGQEMIVFNGSVFGKDGKARPIRFVYNEKSVTAGIPELGKVHSGISIELLEYIERFSFHRYETIFFSLKEYR